MLARIEGNTEPALPCLALVKWKKNGLVPWRSLALNVRRRVFLSLDLGNSQTTVISKNPSHKKLLVFTQYFFLYQDAGFGWWFGLESGHANRLCRAGQASPRRRKTQKGSEKKLLLTRRDLKFIEIYHGQVTYGCLNDKF